MKKKVFKYNGRTYKAPLLVATLAPYAIVVGQVLLCIGWVSAVFVILWFLDGGTL